MINPGFTGMGLWIVMIIITFLVTSLIAIVIGDGKDFIDFLDNSVSVALIIFVILFELFLCSVYVKFKINPETYGYTRIEQEATEGE